MTADENPIGLSGIELVEMVSPAPETLRRTLRDLGFSRTMRHPRAAIDLYEQGDIRVLVHRAPTGHAERALRAHGATICGMGWRTSLDPARAATIAHRRGACLADGDYRLDGTPLPALVGIGDSLIYLCPRDPSLYTRLGFVACDAPDPSTDRGFLCIDHLTNNVAPGTMATWVAFYKDVFGFTEVRSFDIRGERTGLTSYALRSPDGSFCIPINEGSEARSQINEYLDEHRGPGVQHLAFLTRDLLGSLRGLDGSSSVSFLDIDAGYYEEAFARVPTVREDRAEIARRQVLVDGDAEGYLLQIFTRNLLGPAFIELIQRDNHHSFGEGNFGALFRTIERDQVKRGYLPA